MTTVVVFSIFGVLCVVALILWVRNRTRYN